MSRTISVLIVEDDADLRCELAAVLGGAGRVVTVAPDLVSARDLLGKGTFDVAFFDYNLPDGTSPETIEWATSQKRVDAAYGMSGMANFHTAVSMTQAGCLDVLPKPLELRTMDAAIDLALKNRAGRGELGEWREQFAGEIIGDNSNVIDMLSMIRRVADSDATVLITGESGTGKELCARALHRGSHRADKAFVALNCAAIPESLIEAELFGHVRGAFSGAVGARAGRISSANGGTLFLDEIGDMPLSAQAKLLRVLQEGEITPIGSDRCMIVDIRVVAATNKDLMAMVAEGKFRADLYFRLNVIPVEVPALRDRKSDIRDLALHALEHANARHGRKVTGFAPRALKSLEGHAWPGNVRELMHAVERAVLLRATGTIEAADLPLATMARGTGSIPIPNFATVTDGLDLRPALEKLECELIGRALERTGGNRTEAAGLLGLNRTTLVEKIRKHGC